MQGAWENGQFVLAATKDSQIERLRAENKAAWDSAEYNAKRARAAEATIERLREYARHKITCGTLSADYFIEKQGCDCGYDDLMAELGEGKRNDEC